MKRTLLFLPLLLAAPAAGARDTGPLRCMVRQETATNTWTEAWWADASEAADSSQMSLPESGSPAQWSLLADALVDPSEDPAARRSLARIVDLQLAQSLGLASELSERLESPSVSPRSRENLVHAIGLLHRYARNLVVLRHGLFAGGLCASQREYIGEDFAPLEEEVRELLRHDTSLWTRSRDRPLDQAALGPATDTTTRSLELSNCSSEAKEVELLVMSLDEAGPPRLRRLDTVLAPWSRGRWELDGEQHYLSGHVGDIAPRLDQSEHEGRRTHHLVSR